MAWVIGVLIVIILIGGLYRILFTASWADDGYDDQYEEDQ